MRRRQTMQAVRLIQLRLPVPTASPTTQDPKGRQNIAHSTPPQSPVAVENPKDDGPATRDTGVFARSLESNSGSAFVRSFALAVDPATKSTPTFGAFQMLAWNAFLDERKVPEQLPLLGLTGLLSLVDMHALANVYFSKVDPCYCFIDRDHIYEHLDQRWLSHGQITLYDAILSGVAALGCVFSNLQDLNTEAILVNLVKQLLDRFVFEMPSVESAMAWLLRTIYLRITARMNEAWMSSCTAMHHIDGAGLHREHDLSNAFQQETRPCKSDTKRRIFGIARQLNVWLSFDLARTRVTLQDVSYILPTEQPTDDYTTELLELLPYTESLDPSKVESGDELVTALTEVLDRTHTQPPSILAQTNLTLCLYRRLYTIKWPVPQDVLDQVIALVKRGVHAVRAAIASGSPWHHVANVPFQGICTLLAIDSNHSFSMLHEAVSCLETVLQTYQTKATRDAVSAAYALIFMHQKRREAEMSRQADLLRLYPLPAQSVPVETFDNAALSQAFTGLPWFSELIPNVDLENFDQYWGNAQLP